MINRARTCIGTLPIKTYFDGIRWGSHYEDIHKKYRCCNGEDSRFLLRFNHEFKLTQKKNHYNSVDFPKIFPYNSGARLLKYKNTPNTSEPGFLKYKNTPNISETGFLK